MEITRLLRGGDGTSILGYEHYFDLSTRASVASRLVRNRRCRLDHVGGGAEPIESRCAGAPAGRRRTTSRWMPSSTGTKTILR